MNTQTKATSAGPPRANRVNQTLIISIFLLLALLFGIWSVQANAASVTAPVSGEIEQITVNDMDDHWSGGVIVAGGQNIIVPRNILIDLPANRVTLQQVFSEAPATCRAQSPPQTGLAKGDTCNATGTGGLATIQATRLDNGNVIAGDLFIQKAAEVVTGQITFINHNDGYFRVNGVVGSATTGVMVRLNDPDSRHTIQQGLGCEASSPNCSPDPRFTLDGDNYTNVSSTGYPMCIPSTQSRTFADTLGLGVTTAQAQADGTGDFLCPTTNRPGQPVADSRRFAPILVGDSITAEGNYETVGGVRFLSAHSSAVSAALSTSTAPGQPDYLFLDEVEIDAPGFQNQRARSLIIGYATLAPTDIMIWSIHYDPQNNAPHEFPLASSLGCDAAAGPGTCSAQGLVGAGANIFKIRHDVDFAVATKPRWNPCAHLQADIRFSALTPCSVGGGTIAEQFAILSPIPHEIQARTGRKFASMQATGTPLVTVDINGNEATNGQYLFPFGMGLGGISTPEMNEINLDAMTTPLSFSGIPWNLDRRLGPGGCLDTGCETGAPGAASFALDPFPFEGLTMDPRMLSTIPAVPYNDPNYISGGPLSDVRNRILSFVDSNATRPGGNAIGVNATGNFTTALLNWQAPPPSAGGPGSAAVIDTPLLPQALICSANTAFNSPPVAVADVVTTDAGVAVTIPVLLNDSDINVSDVLTITGVSSPTLLGGTAVLNTDGTVTFTPAASISGTDTFTYTVTDGSAVTTGTVTVTVNVAGNNAPVTVAGGHSTLEDTPVAINVLEYVTDADNDVLTVASVSPSVNGGSVTLSGSLATYTPMLNFNGTDTFTYSVSDGRGGTATGTVTVNVTPLNDTPVAVNDNVGVSQGTAMNISVLANDTDVDSDALTVSLGAGRPTLGTVTINGQTVTYTANPGVTGNDTFTYTITDPGGLTATGTVTVNVTAPAVDVVGFTPPTEFRISKGEWRVTGTGSVDGNNITLRLGTNPNGTIVGTSPVTLGIWLVRVKNGIQPNGNTQVTAWSSGGGSASSAITIRN